MPRLANTEANGSASLLPPHLLRGTWALCHSSVILLLCCAILFLMLGVPGTLLDVGNEVDDVIAFSHLASASLPSVLPTGNPFLLVRRSPVTRSPVPALLLIHQVFHPPKFSLSLV